MLFRCSGYKLPGARVATRCKNKCRSAIEEWFLEAEDPTVTYDPETYELTIEFEPMSWELATLMTESKAVFVGFIRIGGGGGRSHSHDRYSHIRPGHNHRAPRFIRVFQAGVYPDYEAPFLRWYEPTNKGCPQLIAVSDPTRKSFAKVDKAELIDGKIVRSLRYVFDLEAAREDRFKSLIVSQKFQYKALAESYGKTQGTWTEEFYAGLYYRGNVDAGYSAYHLEGIQYNPVITTYPVPSMFAMNHFFIIDRS